jgi:hypothetical protein
MRITWKAGQDRIAASSHSLLSAVSPLLAVSRQCAAGKRYTASRPYTLSPLSAEGPPSGGKSGGGAHLER